MTRRKPRTFTPEFRQMAVDLALQGDQSIAQIERDLGLSDGLKPITRLKRLVKLLNR